jgi:hypothetical protein
MSQQRKPKPINWILMDWKTLALQVHLGSAVLAIIFVAITHTYVHRAFWHPERAPLSSRVLHGLSVAIWLGLLLMSISGAFVFAEKLDELVRSEKFLAKMTIVLVLIVNGIFLNLVITPRVLALSRTDWFYRNFRFRKVMRLAVPSVVTSLVSWCGALLLGASQYQDWAYFQIIGAYLVFIVLGILAGFLMMDSNLSTNVPALGSFRLAWRKSRRVANGGFHTGNKPGASKR